MNGNFGVKARALAAVDIEPNEGPWPPDEKSRLRLELLKLVHRFDHEPKALIERARALEAYVVGEAEAQPTPRKGRRSEPSDT